MNLREQAQAMIELQDTFNQRINKNWRNAGYAWYRAIWLEAAELCEKYPWKWWKAGQPIDKTQAHLELTDVWHFLISQAIVEGFGVDRLTAVLELANRATLPHSADVEVIESLALAALQQDLNATTTAFAVACCTLGLDASALYRLYVGKNALNVHRNKHGYKEGTYLKVWNGLEDNQHLEAIMESGVIDFDGVVAALAEHYKLATSAGRALQ